MTGHMVGPDNLEHLLGAVHELLNDSLEREGQSREGEETPLVLALPKAWIVLAAWLQRGTARKSGGVSMSALPPDPANPEVLARASNYLWWQINDHMHGELNRLAAGSHPLLHPEADDIPF